MSELQDVHKTDDIETKARRGYARRNADGAMNGGVGNGGAAGATGDDVALAFDEFMRAFEAYKEANDERLQQIEQQISEDVVTSEKLERINRAIDQHKAAMDQLVVKAARPHLSGSAIRSSGVLLQHKAAFEAYVRHGEAHGLHLLEQKALSVGSGADGGYLVPPETEAAVIRGVKNISPIRAIAYTKVANASWEWDKIGYVATGEDGGFDTTNPSDNLIDLIYSLKSEYRSNAHWVMNRATQAAIRKIKDADGNYIWQPGERADLAPTLMNYPIAESEDMPNIASDSYSIGFGDFNRGYLVVDRAGIRVLRDPYSAKPYVLFYTTKRVGGGVQDFDAIKLLKFGTS